jgi:hypothetical protein
MAKANQSANRKTKGMHASSDRKQRGRTSITDKGKPAFAKDPSSRTPTGNARKTQATKPIGPGGTVHRGDRRDMSRTYTNNAKHASRGTNARPDVSTRKR